MTTLHNTHDFRRKWIGAWETAPLVYADLSVSDIGRVVIYKPRGRAQALEWNQVGIITSFRNNLVFARFSDGVTSQACNPIDLCFGIEPLDGP